MLRDELYVSWTSGAFHRCSAFRKVQGDKDGEKNSLSFQQLFFGQAIFMVATKSITLTSPGAIA
jgi:hypothetical protein